MARVKKTKKVEVQKFGGVDELGSVSMHGFEHEANSIEAKSQTRLEDDIGEGEATIIRCFTFGINAEAFQKNPPNKQDLFNYHIRGIEMALWKDGMKLFTDVEPRIKMDVKKMQYQIFVAARPMKGYLLQERPQSLSQLLRAEEMHG